jgi:protein-tyrosine phosphatase
VIDLHTHVLPGIDDGPATLDEAVALARDAVAAGVTTLVATPHVSAHHPNDAATIHAAVEVLRAALGDAGVALDVRPGAELEIERAVALDDDELRRLRLGGGRYLLLECPLSPYAGDIAPLVAAIHDRGHEVLLAHPERSPMFQRDPAQLHRLVAHGALTSITAGALGGRFGEPARKLGVALVEDGLAHNLTSDMHDRRGRPAGIVDALGAAREETFGLEASLAWLTREVPAAILDGGPLPPAPDVGSRPQPAARSPWRRLRRRRA